MLTAQSSPAIRPWAVEPNRRAQTLIQRKWRLLRHLRQLEHLAQALTINEASDRIYSWLPLYHDMGLMACFMLPMVCHLPVVMQSPLDWVMHPETMLQIIGEYRCTLAWMPNFAFQFVSRRASQDHRTPYDLSSVRALINCSEPVRASSNAGISERLRAVRAE